MLGTMQLDLMLLGGTARTPSVQQRFLLLPFRVLIDAFHNLLFLSEQCSILNRHEQIILCITKNWTRIVILQGLSAVLQTSKRSIFCKIKDTYSLFIPMHNASFLLEN